MGCSTSSPTSLGDAAGGGGGNERKPSAATGNKTSAEDGDTAASKYPASEAFIIPFDQSVVLPLQSLNEAAATASTVDLTKAMPKRLQQLIEQQNAVDSDKTANLDHIEDKLQKAEERRKELLRQKVEQIQKTTQMMTAPRSPATAEADSSLQQVIQSKALDDDSKQQLLDQTLTMTQKS